jgi:hypothetical protein
MGFAADSEQRADQDVGHCYIYAVAANAMQIVCDQVVTTDSYGQRWCSLAVKFLDVFLLGGNELCFSLGEELVERYI